jgi:hypothetical protein
MGMVLTIVTGGMTTVNVYPSVVTQPYSDAIAWRHTDDVDARFREYAQRWKAETDSVDATLTSMILNPSYQRIIALGWDAVPLILAEYRRQPDHWGWALEMITGENPVPADAEGDVEAIGAAWIAWGRARGLTA